MRASTVVFFLLLTVSCLTLVRCPEAKKHYGFPLDPRAYSVSKGEPKNLNRLGPGGACSNQLIPIPDLMHNHGFIWLLCA